MRRNDNRPDVTPGHAKDPRHSTRPSQPKRRKQTAHIGQELRTLQCRISILLHLKHMYLLYIVHTLIHCLDTTPHDCDPVSY
jgi:hypothetical protein